jgi:hydrogenase maturation protein HypF
MLTAHTEGRRIRIRGTVQGVGFRPWVYRIAHSAGITGRVCNDSAGVTIEAFGDDAALDRFATLLKFPPAAARILAYESAAIPAEAASDFQIVRSEASAERRVSIPPDLAACPDCVSEIFDPADRRHRYAFTNCTNCGPRFTIARDVPYDRATTTMAAFTMCPACRREYEDVGDRRFHAQPNACPLCGPRLTLHAADGSPLCSGDPIAAAADALTHGRIVAVKGIGGFHLACDATSEDAVRRLRARKHREEKPLAVMVRTIDDAAAIGVIGAVERDLLMSVERPIVLLQKHGDRWPVAGATADQPPSTSHLLPSTIALAPSVAPRNRHIGVMLAYSPLHHLLLSDAGVPLVMTSANVTDEPIAYRNGEALQRLVGIADLFLLHDRDIETRCDDSVVTVIAGAGAVMRRSRGYVPRATRLSNGVTRPVLACGALLKNTFAIASGDQAWLGPHIGDLDNLESFRSYRESIARMERFLDVRPQAVAYDMHPDYLSTRYALRRPETVKIAVQHHHAHIVSAMAEHGIDGPAIGIAYDGTGYGTDGTMWGGEILVATPAAFRRVATFRPLRLVGGDRAIREPWRIAVALAWDAFGGGVPDIVRSMLATVDAGELARVEQVLRSDFPAPLARGVGRYFDAFGALFLGRHRASFEGQIALEWNQAASPAAARSYRFDLRDLPECLEIDLRPALADALRDREAGRDTRVIAAAFHDTLADATAAVVRLVVAREGALPIVASGGCFQNARLAEAVVARLAPEHDVRLQREVPCGDGGIALGQAVIADALLRAEN